MQSIQFDKQIAYQHYLGSADGMCAVDHELKYVAWNKALERISGVAANEAIGRNVFDLFPFFEEIGEREVHQRVFNGETILMEPRPYNIPEKKRTGYFQGLYAPWYNSSGEIVGIFMTIRDVGKSLNHLLFLHDLSFALAKSKSMQETLDVTLEILVRSTLAKRGFITLFSEDRKELVVEARLGMIDTGQKNARIPADINGPLTIAARSGHPVIVGSVEEGRKYDAAYGDYLAESGDVATASFPLIVEDNSIGALLIAYDTEYTLTPDDIHYVRAACNLCSQSYARAKQFEKEKSARSAAEAADQAKTRFLASVSHELRTPMTVIIGQSELIRGAIHTMSALTNDDTLKKISNYANNILRHGKALAEILDDILDLSKIESGRIRIRPEIVYLTPWLNDLSTSAKQLAANKPLEVILNIDPSTPEHFITDPHRSRQIMLNLLTNAVKYTDKGKITIHCKLGKLKDGQAALQLTVKDTGSGIISSQIPFLHDGSNKSNEKLKRHGSGIGLTIASRLAHALGGSLSLVRSEVGKGSTFEVCLPNFVGEWNVTPSLIESMASPKSSLDYIERQSLRGLCILVAEDELDILDYLAESLTSVGARVFKARNGAEAIEVALTHEIDVFLLDLQMPRIDGLNAAKQIRESAIFKPMIALTAHALPEYREQAMIAGFNRFLVKPVRLPELVETILDLNRSRKAEKHD